jgi:hypothetical protein
VPFSNTSPIQVHSVSSKWAGHDQNPDSRGPLEVEYAFKNRTPYMKFTRDAFSWLEEQVESMIFSAILNCVCLELEMAN